MVLLLYVIFKTEENAKCQLSFDTKPMMFIFIKRLIKV